VRFSSTRRQSPALSLSAAFQQGLAPDGGLYIPERFPTIDLTEFPADASLSAVAATALRDFFAGDELSAQLPAIAAEAFDAAAPSTRIEQCVDALFVLELFHGATAAFKDFGARFLAAAIQRIESGSETPLTVLVATSGDTGGAVAAAFHRRPGVRVVILYPKGRVSTLQERQLTCWGDNILSLRVTGSFDECQQLVKQAFLDASLRRSHRLSSANSINLGRLLPQVCYYAQSSLGVASQTGQSASYIIPAGNLGNACAAAWARQMGFPIARIVLAHNINRTVPDYLASGDWRPRLSIATLASAMDVGDPSNMERLRALYPNIAALREGFTADSVDDAAIRGRIASDDAAWGRLWCPHTATAAEVYARLPAVERRRPWVVVATAHPAKFADIVEPLIGRSIEMPPSLSRLLHLPTQRVDIAAKLDALSEALNAF
jgi:threonine synthase